MAEEVDKGGRPPHIPDEKTRKTVEAMSSYGVPQEDIALVLDIDRKTLSKHYRRELDTAATKANAMVAGRLYQKCMKDDTSSIIFWLKTRAKWRDNSKDDDADNGNIVAALSKLIDKLPS
jgi:hypothetical protein